MTGFSICELDDKMDFWNDCLRRASDYTKIRTVLYGVVL